MRRYWSINLDVDIHTDVETLQFFEVMQKGNQRTAGNLMATR